MRGSKEDAEEVMGMLEMLMQYLTNLLTHMLQSILSPSPENPPFSLSQKRPRLLQKPTFADWVVGRVPVIVGSLSPRLGSLQGAVFAPSRGNRFSLFDTVNNLPIAPSAPSPPIFHGTYSRINTP